MYNVYYMAILYHTALYTFIIVHVRLERLAAECRL